MRQVTLAGLLAVLFILTFLFAGGRVHAGPGDIVLYARETQVK